MRPTRIPSAGPSLVRRGVRGAGVAALLAILSVGPAGAEDLGTRGQWMVTDRDEHGQVELVLAVGRSKNWSHWHGTTVPLDRLKGLTAQQLRGGSTDVRFVLERDAGTFVCEGKAGQGRGAGLFELQLDSGFAAELARRGVGRPTEAQQIRLAFADVGIALLDELRTQHVETPRVDQLVTMADHGVDQEFVRGLSAAGYRGLSVDELLMARDHGVDPAYVAGMAELGHHDMAMADLIKLRDHGVDPAFVQGMARIGYHDMSASGLQRLRDHGVDPHYVADMASAGYRNLDVSVLVRARDHGVDGRFARGVTTKLGERVSIERLIAIRDRGGLD